MRRRSLAATVPALFVCASAYACGATFHSEDGADAGDTSSPGEDAAFVDASAPDATVPDAALDSSVPDSTVDDASPDDAAIADAESGSAADAAPTQGDAGTDIFDDNFESDTNSCVGWQALTGTATLSTAQAHSGSHSCRICSNAMGSFVAYLLPVSGSAASYELDFWVRSDPGDGADAGLGDQNTNLIELEKSDGGSAAMGFSGTPLPTGGWVLQQSVAIASTSWSQAALVSSSMPGSSATHDKMICVYVDDVRFYKQQ